MNAERNWTDVHKAIKQYRQHEASHSAMFQQAMGLVSSEKSGAMITRWNYRRLLLRREVTQQYYIAVGVGKERLDLIDVDLYDFVVQISGFEDKCHE